MHKQSQYKLIIKALKIFPILGAFILLIRVILTALYEYNNPVMELFVGTSIIGGVLLLLASSVLEFCFIHKMFIYYNIFVGFCIDFQSIIGWGVLREPMRGIAIGTGLLLFVILILKRCCRL